MHNKIPTVWWHCESLFYRTSILNMEFKWQGTKRFNIRPIIYTEKSKRELSWNDKMKMCNIGYENFEKYSGIFNKM